MTPNDNAIRQGLIDAFIFTTPKLAAAIKDLHAKGASRMNITIHLAPMKAKAPLIYDSAMLYVDQLWSARKARKSGKAAAK